MVPCGQSDFISRLPEAIKLFSRAITAPIGRPIQAEPARQILFCALPEWLRRKNDCQKKGIDYTFAVYTTAVTAEDFFQEELYYGTDHRRRLLEPDRQ
jgi:hypothetical protein